MQINTVTNAIIILVYLTVQMTNNTSFIHQKTQQ